MHWNIAAGICFAPNASVLAIVVFLIGLICILIGRILLIGAAFGVSAGWGFGVLLPFGPLFFRLNHPELAPASRAFRLAGVFCVFLYFFMNPGMPKVPKSYKAFWHDKVPSGPADRYTLEAQAKQKAAEELEKHRAAITAEFDRLNAWKEALRLKKRDLLHSDVNGNILYDAELAEYKAALDRAIAEKHSVEPAKARR